MDEIILHKMTLDGNTPQLERWQKIVHLCTEHRTEVHIAMVGKYTEHGDSYHSVDEALLHGAMAHSARLHVSHIDSNQCIGGGVDMAALFNHIDGILVPGGFGNRGINGALRSISYARMHHIPYFGICMGMQLMAVEFAQNVLNERGAHSVEFEPHCVKPVVTLMNEQLQITDTGGTMRLGAQRAHIVSERLQNIYQNTHLTERHRHRYEIVNDWIPRFQQNGLEVGALYKETLVEALLWQNHPWGIGVQYHPEFTSKPLSPNPLFADFISAALTFHDRA